MGKRLGVIKLSCQTPGVKRNIVLLRGLGRSSAFWLDFPRILSRHANVFMIDLLGTGASPSFWGRGSISRLSQDVYDTICAENIENLHLVGISLGGMVAAQVSQIAETHIKPFFSLSVLNSSARFTKQKRISMLALVRMLWQVVKFQIQHKTFAEFLVSEKYLQNYPQIVEIWDGLWRAEGISKLAVIRQLLAAAFFHGESIYRNLQTPTLFIASKGDRLVTWQNSVILWQAATSSRLQVFNEYGHDITTECPQIISSELEKFMDSIEKKEPLTKCDSLVRHIF